MMPTLVSMLSMQARFVQLDTYLLLISRLEKTAGTFLTLSLIVYVYKHPECYLNNFDRTEGEGSQIRDMNDAPMMSNIHLENG